MKNLIVLIILCLNALSCKTREVKFDDAYKKSVEWLWSQQSADGAWHSKTHNVLKDGRVLSPYILYYLLQVPDSVFHKNKSSVDKAIAFIDQDLWSGDSLISENYPNYAAAYALRIYTQTHINDQKQWRLVQYLRDQQFTELRNTPPGSMAYGGWGYGETDLKPGEFGHVDISHTRRILEALTDAYNHPGKTLKAQLDSSPTLSLFDRHAAHQFLLSVQRAPEDLRLYEGCTDRSNIPYDGGFVSSMYTLSTNKCQPYNVNDCYHYPSYATATCDGLLALHAMGLDSSKEFQDALQWLEKNQRIDVIDGLSKEDPEQWYQIMHFYHWSVRAEAMRVAGIRGSWEKDMIQALIKEQQPEGYYINPLGGVNKEDDPLLSTTFCVQAFTSLNYSHKYSR